MYSLSCLHSQRKLMQNLKKGVLLVFGYAAINKFSIRNGITQLEITMAQTPNIVLILADDHGYGIDFGTTLLRCLKLNTEKILERFIGPDGAPEVAVRDGATHNLGFVVLNALREYIIHVISPKMTPIPCEISDRFLTVDHNQPSVLIEVVQGLEQHQPRDEIEFFEEYKLGECTLELPSGIPQGSPFEVSS